MKPLKVIISGGGTGGHIFPAISIANALKEKHSDIEILFVGALGRMEMEKVPAAGYKIEGLNISGLSRKLSFQLISFPFKVIGSVMKARSIIKKFKPDVVVGVGGYASGPLLYAATGMGVPALIQEQNSYPGITNKMLAKRVEKICVAYNGMEKFFPKEKIILTGNPVRQDILDVEGKKEKGLEYFNLDKTKQTVLVIGGSLGARTVNQAISNAVPLLAEKNIQLVWQTGKAYKATADETVANYKEKGITAHDFITKMDYAYAVADIVVSRAGASSVSELCIVKKASILIPSPNVAEDHQTKNAMALVNNHAAILVKDVDAREQLGKQIISLIADKEQKEKLENNISKLALTSAANVIANEITAIANREKK